MVKAVRVLTAVSVASALALTGCISFESEKPLRSSSKSVSRKGDERVRAEIRMAAGELRVEGGAVKLLEGNFRVRGDDPTVRYEIRAGRGELSIESARSVLGGDNRWDLRLEDKAPLDLTLHLGAGESSLDLRTLSIRSVNVHMGVGELRLDLTGDHANDVDVEVHGGVGHARIVLPKSGMGVDVDAQGGIGQISARGLEKQGGRWVNAARDTAKSLMRVKVRGGVGQIDLVGE